MMRTFTVSSAVVVVVVALFVFTNGANASREKLKIHVPQHIRDIHHYHKETIRHLHHHKPQYAGGFGYGPPFKKPRFGGNRGGKKGVWRGGRYKKRRGRRRNHGGKRYGMNNYAQTYNNWVRNGPYRKDRLGSAASYHRPQYIRPTQPVHQRPTSPQLPPTASQDDDDDDDEDEVEGPEPEEQDYQDEPYKRDPHLDQTPSQVGKKIHANINEIIGLISQYSGRNEHGGHLRQRYGQDGGDDQNHSPSNSPGSRHPPPTGFNHNQFAPAPQNNQHNDVLRQAFQSFSFRGRHPTVTAPVFPLGKPPVVTGSIGGGFGTDKFHGGRAGVSGDHDIGFGEGLEVIHEAAGI